MTEFCSFFVFRPSEIKLIHSISAEVNWTTLDIADPSSRYGFTEKVTSELQQASALRRYAHSVEEQQSGRLLILDAEQDDADNIIQLISAANLILDGFPDRHKLPNHGFPLPENDQERQSIFENIFRTDGYFQMFTHRRALPVAVAVAAKAWMNKKLVYAIHKLALSLQTESVTPESMHPRHGRIFEKHTRDHASHVGTSVAINLAYSAIEELGLAVGASSKAPRSLSRSQFVWNPEVLNPFKERLVKAGIDPERTIDWVTRGDQTEVEIYEMLDTPSDYSDGAEVRDRQVYLYDAINFCEYLRSQMTAHAFSSKTSRLGPYEVYNTQQVARYVLLSTCGLWNTWTEDLMIRHR